MKIIMNPCSLSNNFTGLIVRKVYVRLIQALWKDWAGNEQNTTQTQTHTLKSGQCCLWWKYLKSFIAENK